MPVTPEPATPLSDRLLRVTPLILFGAVVIGGGLIVPMITRNIGESVLLGWSIGIPAGIGCAMLHGRIDWYLADRAHQRWLRWWYARERELPLRVTHAAPLRTPHVADTSEEGCTCGRCSRRYRVDVQLPDELWAAIAGDTPMLCPRCIAEGLERRGEFAAYRLTEANA